MNMRTNGKEHHAKLVHALDPPLHPQPPRHRVACLAFKPQLLNPQLAALPRREMEVVFSLPDRALRRLPQHFAGGHGQPRQLVSDVRRHVGEGVEDVVEEVRGVEGAALCGRDDPRRPVWAGGPLGDFGGAEEAREREGRGEFLEVGDGRVVDETGRVGGGGEWEEEGGCGIEEVGLEGGEEVCLVVGFVLEACLSVFCLWLLRG